ncbi:MAG: hypothetical protein ACR2HX_21340 [Pyrinomonadaceae bacterium]
MRKLLSFAFSVCLVTGLALLLWMIDVVRRTPQIPPQIPDGNYVEIMLHKKKHNHTDDFCVPCDLSFKYVN